MTSAHVFREWAGGSIRTGLHVHSDNTRKLTFIDQGAPAPEEITVDLNNGPDVELVREMLGGIDRDLDEYLNALV